MNKLVIVLILFLLLGGGVLFYQLTQSSQSVKANGKVTIGKNVFSVEAVRSDKDKQIGLTKYKSIKENQGMLFVFDKADNYSFWMKNMKFPIDILFIENDTIVDFVENATPPPADTDPVIYKSDSIADYVLELKSGVVKKNNIQTGNKVKIEIK